MKYLLTTTKNKPQSHDTVEVREMWVRRSVEILNEIWDAFIQWDIRFNCNL